MKLLFLTLPLLLVLSACLPSMEKSALKFQEHARRPEINPQISEEVSFDELRATVLDAKCISCHKHASWVDEVEFQKYVTLGMPEESKMYKAVRTARMPLGKKLSDGSREPVVPLTSEELDYFYRYIQNARAAVPKVTFNELKSKVLEVKCIGCHSKMQDEAQLLENYVVPGNAKKSKLYDSVIKERMPKSPKKTDGTRDPVVPLSAEESELIKNYINGLKPL